MRFVTRRAGLLLLGAAAGTVAAATLTRKPRAAEDTDTDLDDLSEMKLSDPPKPLPEIAFQTADGATHRIADFKGRGMVLNLWATWCRPCVAEMPSLGRLSTRLAPDDIAVLAVSTDHGGAPVVQRFLAEHNIASLPVLLDSQGEIGQALGIRGIPTTLVIDRAGRERGRLEGAADWSSDQALALVRRLASS
jgi:thiol-disulfide isomerase/thioredoxin